MAQQLPHVIPSIYLANYLNDFEPLFPRYGVTLRKFSKGDILTQQGVIHNTAYFIKSGILQLSLGHDQGEKALNLFGPGTVFPVGVEFHTSYMEYEMILQAFSDGEAYAMPYPTLKRIAVENDAFAGELLRENCDFIGYLFFDTLNQTFEPCLSRVCDILYLYLTKVQPKEPVIPLSQGELAKIAGASQAQMERCVQILKKEEVLATSRKQLAILDEKKLLAHCTPGLRENL